jgi:hypothetical protein
MECPVCNSPGLPDYRLVHSICPHCHSDLKGFMLIRQLEQVGFENEFKFKKLKLSFIVTAIVLSILLIGSILYIATRSKQEPGKPEFINDSTAYYITTIAELKQQLQVKPATVDIYYIVQKDDNLSKIAKLFYNNGFHTEQIMTDNNLHEGYNLLPGDTLIIKLKTK